MAWSKRFPDEEVAAFALATKPEDDASNHLQEAWSKVFGRNPDPDDAWDHAILACEAVYIPIVEPKKARATLGGTIGILRNQPEHWDVRLTHNPGGKPVLDELIAMLGVVWLNPGRHGGQPQTHVATQR